MPLFWGSVLSVIPLGSGEHLRVRSLQVRERTVSERWSNADFGIIPRSYVRWGSPPKEARQQSSSI